MKITKNEVSKIGTLSRLHLDESDISEYELQLNKILDYVEQLSSLNTDGVETTSHVLKINNVMREDSAAPSLSRKDALMNAPDHTDKFYRVPKIIE
ncbi:MAG: Asp-tRNA(Asn)/Glu-tRNA(Gln) amidotransferase subunit GatC [Nitrospirae bacterium]|jgi:aspartyl-tRNA(Asn)/glutamyl-tRNA(Gln) amidotransferase subunit C|nr:Asp-tRNA(Asn)/Glu-tRNA(Gln) amidotransferase subunit GatC [Nitrospirota bacterium]